MGATPWCYTAIFRRFEKRPFLKDFCAIQNRSLRGRASHPSYRMLLRGGRRKMRLTHAT
jgi:hypothetical protein